MARGTSSPAHSARLNHGLHETVVSCDVRPEVRQAAQFVRENIQPDILGVRGPKQWDLSSAVFPGKHRHQASDLALANTLQPTHIQATDFRKRTGTTHCPADHQATVLPRCQPGALGSWNPSTALDRAELTAGVQQVTERSLKCTRRRTHQLLSRGYAPPMSLTVAITERMREAKAAGQGDGQALEALYGKEGAEAMRATMALPQWGRKLSRRCDGKATAADLAAVAALPEIHLSPSQPVTPAETDGAQTLDAPAPATQTETAELCPEI